MIVLATVVPGGKISDACLVMGARAWFFLRPRPGELRSLAQNAVEDFLFRDGRLPTDEEGFVRFAEVVVLLEDRRAVEVLRVGYFQHRTGADGTLDQQLVAWRFPAAGPWTLFVTSLPLACALAAASWHLCEKPALRLK